MEIFPEFMYFSFYSIFSWTDAKGTIREIVLPKGLDLDRPKRTRTSFTAEQLYRLELEFQRCQYVVGRERTELARQLNLSETQVRGSAVSSIKSANARGNELLQEQNKNTNKTFKISKTTMLVA